jgi:hypothetical protein
MIMTATIYCVVLIIIKIRVDDFERHRNNVIYEAQRNRNPFIDHPEFVYKIFDIKEEQETASKNKLHSYYYIIITDLRRKEEFLC